MFPSTDGFCGIRFVQSQLLVSRMQFGSVCLGARCSVALRQFRSSNALLRFFCIVPLQKRTFFCFVFELSIERRRCLACLEDVCTIWTCGTNLRSSCTSADPSSHASALGWILPIPRDLHTSLVRWMRRWRCVCSNRRCVCSCFCGRGEAGSEPTPETRTESGSFPHVAIFLRDLWDRTQCIS